MGACQARESPLGAAALHPRKGGGPRQAAWLRNRRSPYGVSFALRVATRPIAANHVIGTTILRSVESSGRPGVKSLEGWSIRYAATRGNVSIVCWG